MISAESRLLLATVTGSTLAKRVHPVVTHTLLCCQPESNFWFSFPFFVLPQKLVGKIPWNIFAQGAPICEEELWNAYALESLCVYKMPAQHFNFPHPSTPISPFNLWLSYNTISPYNHWISFSRLTWDK